MDEEIKKQESFKLAPIFSALTAFLCSVLASYLFSTTWMLLGVIPLMIASSEFSKLVITRQIATSIIVGPLAIVSMAALQLLVKAGPYPVIMAGSFIAVGAFLALAAEKNMGRLGTNIVIALIYGVFFIGAAVYEYTRAGYSLTLEAAGKFYTDTMAGIQESIRQFLNNMMTNNAYFSNISNIDEYTAELAESLTFTIKAVFAVAFAALLEFMGHLTAGIYSFTAKITGYEVIVPLGGWQIEMSHISAIVFLLSEALYMVFYMLEFIGVGVDIPYIVMLNIVILLMPNLLFVFFQKLFRKKPGQTRRRSFPVLIVIVLLFIAPFLLLLALASAGAFSIYAEYKQKKLAALKEDNDDFNNNDDNNNNYYDDNQQ